MSIVFWVLLINFGFPTTFIILLHDNTYAFAAIKVDFNTTASSSSEIPSPSIKLYENLADAHITSHTVGLTKDGWCFFVSK